MGLAVTNHAVAFRKLKGLSLLIHVNIYIKVFQKGSSLKLRMTKHFDSKQ